MVTRLYFRLDETWGAGQVVMPFPCLRSEMKMYGANSGGPVFDRHGRVCAVNCTSFSGTDISYHMPLKGVLSLWARDIEFVPEDVVPRNRTVFELGLARRVPFHPPLDEVFFGFWWRAALKPYHFYLDARAWVRQWLSQISREKE
ncbi:hypothetical protein, partial [Parvibaculum sp.]|jgi:hypothetical protein|uniref:hypothetical protein n=1 Tax=Parvibaculum sp. TaxID=2024848 RepID=UPI0038B3DC99